MNENKELFIEYWNKLTCPKCGTANWFYGGHSQRYPTGSDIEGVKCKKCGEITLLYPDMDSGRNIEDLIIENGLDKPPCII